MFECRCDVMIVFDSRFNKKNTHRFSCPLTYSGHQSFNTKDLPRSLKSHRQPSKFMNQLLTIWKHVHSQMPWLRLRAEPLKTNASSVRSDRSTASSSNVATGFKRKLSSYVEYCQQILMYQISKEQILMYQISKEFLAKCDTIHRSGLCGDCAERLWASGPAGRRCPLCRSGFAGMVRIMEAQVDGGHGSCSGPVPEPKH